MKYTFDWNDLNGKHLEIIVRTDVEYGLEITCVYGYDAKERRYYCLAVEEKTVE